MHNRKKLNLKQNFRIADPQTTSSYSMCNKEGNIAKDCCTKGLLNTKRVSSPLR